MPALPCACANLRRAARSITRLYNHELRAEKIEITQFTLLMALDRTGDISQGKLGRLLALDSTTLTRMLKPLKKQGWIQGREGDDRRVRIIRLTPAGRAKLQHGLPHWKRASEARIEGMLGEPSMRKLEMLLTRFARSSLGTQIIFPAIYVYTFIITNALSNPRRKRNGVQIIFGISVLSSLASSAAIAALCGRGFRQRTVALHSDLLLVAPHMFLRFFGLSFLVPGVVSPLLSHAFAAPAAYGDFVAGLLAILAMVALKRRISWAMAAVWVFNLWGTGWIFSSRSTARRVPGSTLVCSEPHFIFQAAIVPPVLMTHFLIFGLLFSRRQGQRRDSTPRVSLGVNSPV